MEHAIVLKKKRIVYDIWSDRQKDRWTCQTHFDHKSSPEKEGLN